MRHRTDQFIPGLLAGRVIDDREPIELTDEHRHRRAVRTGRERALEASAEQRTVRQPGQQITIRLTVPLAQGRAPWVLEGCRRAGDLGMQLAWRPDRDVAGRVSLDGLRCERVEHGMCAGGGHVAGGGGSCLEPGVARTRDLEVSIGTLARALQRVHRRRPGIGADPCRGTRNGLAPGYPDPAPPP